MQVRDLVSPVNSTKSSNSQHKFYGIIDQLHMRANCPWLDHSENLHLVTANRFRHHTSVQRNIGISLNHIATPIKMIEKQVFDMMRWKLIAYCIATTKS